MSKIKLWNERVYVLGRDGYIFRSKLAWDVWNYYNRENKIERGDGCVIHHLNGDHNDDRIENLQKMTKIEHTILHNKNKNWNSGDSRRGRFKNRFVKYGDVFHVTNNTIDKYQYQEFVYITMKGIIFLRTLSENRRI